MKQADRKPYQILVVDDDGFVRNITAEILELEGFEVMTMSSGDEALRSCQHGGLKPDLALVDINMRRGMDGREFAQRFKALCQRPVIMLTGVDKPETIIEALARYAEGYITKPFRRGELVARVRLALWEQGQQEAVQLGY